MSNIILYRKLPFESNWVDISSKLKIDKVDIEERVNGSGICSLMVSNASRWADRNVFPGQQYRIYLKTASEHQFWKPDFEGYIPKNYMNSNIGVSAQKEIPIIGYIKKFQDIRNRYNLTGISVPSAVCLLNEQIRHPVQGNFMRVSAKMMETENVSEEVDMTNNCLDILESIRTGILDTVDTLFPRFYHYITTYTRTLPLLRLVREPDIKGLYPDIVIDTDKILQIQVENTSDLLTSMINGDNSTWMQRYTNRTRQYYMDHYEEDNQDEVDNGYKSNLNKTKLLVRGKAIGKSTRVTLSGNHQIPILSLINIDTDMNGLTGNFIVYGKRISRELTTTTELLIRNLPDASL